MNTTVLHYWRPKFNFIVIAFIGLFSSILHASNVDPSIYKQIKLTGTSGAEVSYYFSQAKKQGAPLLLMIQGSGCQKIITKTQHGYTSNIFNLYKIASQGDFSVLVIDKPYSGQISGYQNGTAQHACSKNFNEYFTVENWSGDISYVLQTVYKNEAVVPEQVVILGLPEGAGIATQIAKDNKIVSHVILSGGSGTTQFFDFIISSYKNCFDRIKCLKSDYLIIDDILAHPLSIDKFAWGHPYKRWSSFFRLFPVQNLVESKAKVYSFFGTADKATPALSQELLVSKLKAFGKDITFRRIPEANHSLQSPGDSSYMGLEMEINLAFDWFWKSLKNNNTD